MEVINFIGKGSVFQYGNFFPFNVSNVFRREHGVFIYNTQIRWLENVFYGTFFFLHDFPKFTCLCFLLWMNSPEIGIIFYCKYLFFLFLVFNWMCTEVSIMGFYYYFGNYTLKWVNKQNKNMKEIRILYFFDCSTTEILC